MFTITKQVLGKSVPITVSNTRNDSNDRKFSHWKIVVILLEIEKAHFDSNILIIFEVRYMSQLFTVTSSVLARKLGAVAYLVLGWFLFKWN